jgi:hypothetical protein
MCDPITHLQQLIPFLPHKTKKASQLRLQSQRQGITHIKLNLLAGLLELSVRVSLHQRPRGSRLLFLYFSLSHAPLCPQHPHDILCQESASPNPVPQPPCSTMDPPMQHVHWDGKEPDGEHSEDGEIPAIPGQARTTQAPEQTGWRRRGPGLGPRPSEPSN